MEELYIRTGLLFHPTSVSRVLRKRLGYSLRVYAEVAKQRNGALRELYLACLDVLLDDVKQLLFLDEAAKDRLASRRAKAWGRTGGNFELTKWFLEDFRYMMMGACNITGFLPECCKLHMRSGTQALKTLEGASGTVDQEKFALLIEHFIVPVVGRIEFKEPHSIVVLDNASVHFPPCVIKLIEAKGGGMSYYFRRSLRILIRLRKCSICIRPN